MNTKTTLNSTLLLVRVVLATVMAAHGAQKLLGWFGGYGFEGTLEFFTGYIGLPYGLAALIIFTESVGMIALLLGFASRFLAGSLVLIMIGAIVTVHGSFGFFMNWSGAQGGEGFEFHILVIALAFVLTANGAGAYSVDAWISSRLRESNRVVSAIFS